MKKGLCRHGRRVNEFCRVCSAVKMVMLTEGDLKNEVWYSFLKHNKKPYPIIIKDMLKRFMHSKKDITHINRIKFYGPGPDRKLIHEL